MSNLAPFEDKEVIATTVAIKSAGDGLSQAMAIDPRELHHGETIYVVLQCVVDDVKFKPVDKKVKAGPQIRVHSLIAGTATIVDEATVGEDIERQADRIEEFLREEAEEAARIKAAEKGMQELDFTESDAGGESEPAAEPDKPTSIADAKAARAKGNSEAEPETPKGEDAPPPIEAWSKRYTQAQMIEKLSNDHGVDVAAENLVAGPKGPVAERLYAIVFG